MTLDAVAFDALVTWLDALQRDQGIAVARAQLERQTAPGAVNANLSLVRR